MSGVSQQLFIKLKQSIIQSTGQPLLKVFRESDATKFDGREFHDNSISARPNQQRYGMAALASDSKDTLLLSLPM